MADLRTRLARLWEEVRGRSPVTAPPPETTFGPAVDADELLGPVPDESVPPAWQAEPISGQTMVIVYKDSRGAASQRQIVCKRLEGYSSSAQLVAWCDLRRQQRTFRVDRIVSATDLITGEVYEPGLVLLEAFTLDRQSTGRYRFGLPPKKFAAFNAALNIMAFVARCDGQWHPLEAGAIEDFVMACWLRLDFPGDLDLTAVAAHVSRLAPDAETVWTAVECCAANPQLAALVIRHLGNLIDADGVHHPQEVWWATQLAETLKP